MSTLMFGGETQIHKLSQDYRKVGFYMISGGDKKEKIKINKVNRLHMIYLKIYEGICHDDPLRINA